VYRYTAPLIVRGFGVLPQKFYRNDIQCNLSAATDRPLYNYIGVYLQEVLVPLTCPL
jgi:hypothetical protein